MANKIARGTTGDTTITIPHYWNQCGFAGGFDWPGYFDDRIVIDRIGGGIVPLIKSLTTNTIIQGQTSGWNAFIDMSVTVPLTAPAGNYRVTRTTYEVGEERCGTGADTREVWFQYSEFEVVCIAVRVNITKLSSAKIPGSSPAQYKHKYSVQAKASGGTKPYNYSWSTSSGSLSTSGDSGILTITNSNPTAAGISATVTCIVTDSNDPECEDTDTASIVDGKPAIEGGGPCVGSGDSRKRCSAGGICVQSTGNNPVPSGGSDPQQYSRYGGHGG